MSLQPKVYRIYHMRGNQKAGASRHCTKRSGLGALSHCGDLCNLTIVSNIYQLITYQVGYTSSLLPKCLVGLPSLFAAKAAWKPGKTIAMALHLVTANRTSADFLCRFSHSSFILWGRSPMPPLGWLEYRKRNLESHAVDILMLRLHCRGSYCNQLTPPKNPTLHHVKCHQISAMPVA